jgi:hypothetical protein
VRGLVYLAPTRVNDVYVSSQCCDQILDAECQYSHLDGPLYLTQYVVKEVINETNLILVLAINMLGVRVFGEVDAAAQSLSARPGL